MEWNWEKTRLCICNSAGSRTVTVTCEHAVRHGQAFGPLMELRRLTR